MTANGPPPNASWARISPGTRLNGIYEIDQLMRRRLERCGVRLRGADVHVPVDLCRIDADDFTRQFAHEIHGDAGS